MSPQPIEFKKPVPTHKVFTKTDVARMFDMRADGHSDAEIGRRFGVSSNKIAALIGRKRVDP